MTVAARFHSENLRAEVFDTGIYGFPCSDFDLVTAKSIVASSFRTISFHSLMKILRKLSGMFYLETILACYPLCSCFSISVYIGPDSIREKIIRIADNREFHFLHR